METVVHAAAKRIAENALIFPQTGPPPPPFELTWQTAVVTTQLSLTLIIGIYVLRRRATRRHLSQPNTASPALLLQPQPWCSLDALLAFRLAALVFYVVVQVVDVFQTHFTCLAFYTSWNFIVQGAYFGIAAYRTQQLRRVQQQQQHGENDDNTSMHTALLVETTAGRRHKLVDRPQATTRWLTLSLVLDVCLAASVLVSIVTWSILLPFAIKLHATDKLLNGISYCQHALNVVVLQLDWWATRHVVSRHALPLIVLWGCIYTLFAWVLHATVIQTMWPYPFMDLRTPYAPLWYAGGLVAHFAAFGVVFALSKCKAKRQ